MTLLYSHKFKIILEEDCDCGVKTSSTAAVEKRKEIFEYYSVVAVSRLLTIV
jgi:hypothetical protein